MPALLALACASAEVGPRETSAKKSRVGETAYPWQLPAGFPEPFVPADNPMSDAKVRLGRELFYEPRLSRTGELSCSGCHRQELAFTDGRVRAVGATGERHPRNAMSLTNVAYNQTYNWADPTLDRLEKQVFNPILNRDPVEMGFAGHEDEILARLRADGELTALFDAAFPNEGIHLDTIVRALAAFERTLISGNSRYDRFLFWGEPLTAEERRGMGLFFSERTRCSECHAGLNLSGPVRIAGTSTSDVASFAEAPGVRAAEFHNTGLFDLDGAGAYPEPNRGVLEHTGRAEDMGRFRAPTLRNVEVTAPYMHDGSLDTLEDVVDFYAAGGRGAGRRSPLKSKLLSGFELSDEERADLVAFLGSLTDRDFLTDPRFGAP